MSYALFVIVGRVSQSNFIDDKNTKNMHEAVISGKMQIKIKKTRFDAIAPSYSHEGDAGFDLYACEDISLKPFERAIVPTGISMAIPQGFVGLVWDKSGRAAKEGIKTMGGVIDSTYRGEIGVIVKNLGRVPILIKKDTKIAQMLIQPVQQVVFEEGELDDTARGEGGFGSTGLRQA